MRRQDSCFDSEAKSNRKTNYKNVMKTLSFLFFIVCVVMFVVEMVVAQGFQPLSANPMLGPDALTLAHLGSGYGWRTQTKLEVYRLFSPIFLHGGVFHILGNMLFLTLMGVPLEQKWGWRKYAIVLAVAGIGASLFSTVVRPDSVSVGASGALFGLLGASLADLTMHWTTQDPTARRMQLVQQVLFIVIWMAVSFGSKYIDGWAHLGGLVFGFLLGVGMWGPESEVQLLIVQHQLFFFFKKKQIHPRMKTLGRPFGVSITVALFLLLSGLLFGGAIQTKQVFDGY
jgi:membrane associated rhomboid family serine protease